MVEGDFSEGNNNVECEQPERYPSTNKGEEHFRTPSVRCWYGTNICVLPKFICQSPHTKCYGIWRWNLLR